MSLPSLSNSRLGRALSAGAEKVKRFREADDAAPNNSLSNLPEDVITRVLQLVGNGSAMDVCEMWRQLRLAGLDSEDYPAQIVIMLDLRELVRDQSAEPRYIFADWCNNMNSLLRAVEKHVPKMAFGARLDEAFRNSKLWGHRASVMVLVAQYGDALRYASDELKADGDIVLAAVTQSGLALEYASDELKGDGGVVFAAVQQHGLALFHASTEPKADHKVVLAAVTQNGLALQWASDALKADGGVVLAAVTARGQIHESPRVP